MSKLEANVAKLTLMRLDLSHDIVLKVNDKDEKLLNPNPIKEYKDLLIPTSPDGKKMFASSISFTTNHNNNTTESDFLNNNSAIVYV